MNSAPRIIFCQPALPSYRRDYYARLAAHWGARFCLYYSRTQMGVLTAASAPPPWAVEVDPAKPLLRGVLEWQPGIADLQIRRGDVVILSGGPRALSTLVLAVRARIVGARTIWFGHFWSASSKPWRFAIRMVLMRLAHAVLFYTDLEVSEYRQGVGRRDQRPVSALNNGLSLDPIAAVRQPYSAASRAREILFIGRITEKVGLDLLLTALAKPALADVRLHIVGDGATKPELVGDADALGIAEQITWHPPTVDEREIAAVAGRCRLFVYPGSVGLSLIHAMAHGLPAIVNSSRRRNMPEIAAFTDGETGLAFQPDDADDLAQKIAAALADEKRLDRWSQTAQERVETMYNTRGMATRTIALVEALSDSQ